MAIVKSSSNIRERPSLQSAIVGALVRDSDVEVLSRVQNEELQWCRVSQGYVACKLLYIEDERAIEEMLEDAEPLEIDEAPIKERFTTEEYTQEEYRLAFTQDDIKKLQRFFTLSESKEFHTTPISLETLVQECVKRNSALLLQQIQKDIGTKKIKYEEGILDPILSFSATRSHAHIPNDAIDSAIQLSSVYKDSVDLWSAGVAGTISSGAKWDISVNGQSKWSTYIEDKYSEDKGTKEYSNKIDLNIRQPLMKGYGSENTLVKINIAKIDSLMARSEYAKSTMDLIGSVIQLYWKLYGSYKLYLSWEKSLSIAQEQLENIEQSLTYGKRSQLELYSAQKSVSLRRVELYNTKTTIFDIQNKILNLLSLSSSRNEHLLLIPVDDAAIEEIKIPDLELSYEQSIASWPELQILQEKLNSARVKVEYSKNQLDPQLDFAFNVNKRSLDTELYGAWNDLANEQYLSWSSGLEFSMPIFNDYAEKNYEMEKLKYLQSSVELSQIRRTLNNGLHSKIVNLKNNKSSFIEYLHGITFQNKLVNLEYQRLQLGKSSIVELFEQQENLIKYERKMFANIIDLKLAEAALQKASGSLLQRFQIELDVQREYKLAKDTQYENQ